MKQGSDSEKSTAQPPERETMLLRIYIADETIASGQALANLREICARYIHGLYEIEVVDILLEPLRALNEGIIVTPTLVRLSPLPVRKIVGNLQDTMAVRDALGLRESVKNEKS